jgi:hypothetical protein
LPHLPTGVVAWTALSYSPLCLSSRLWQLASCVARPAQSETIVSNRVFNVVLAISAIFIVVAPVIAVLELDSRRYVEGASILALWVGTIAGLIYWSVA